MWKENEAEEILLDQLKEFKISRNDFQKLLSKTIDEEIKESTLAGPKKISVFTISEINNQSVFGAGLIEEKLLQELTMKHDILVPAINMVKYFTH